MSVSRTQQLLALVVGLVAFAGESGASSTYASPAEAGAQWLVANENLNASWGRAEEVRPLGTAEAIEALRALDLRLPAYWGASNTLTPKVTAVSPTCQKAFAAKVTLRAGRSHSSTWLSALVAARSPDRSWSGDVYATASAVNTPAAAMATDIAPFTQLVQMRDPGRRGAVNQAPVTSFRPNADETRVSGPAQLARALPSKGRIA